MGAAVGGGVTTMRSVGGIGTGAAANAAGFGAATGSGALATVLIAAPAGGAAVGVGFAVPAPSLVQAAAAAIVYLVALKLLRRFPPEVRQLVQGRSMAAG